MAYCNCACARDVSDLQRTVSSLGRQVRDLEYDLDRVKREFEADIRNLRDSLRAQIAEVYPS